MFYNYILHDSKNNYLYGGYASDLRKRLKEHNQGLNKSTKPFKPWTLIYYEACLNKEDAKRRENYLKTSQGDGYKTLSLRNFSFSGETRKASKKT